MLNYICNNKVEYNVCLKQEEEKLEFTRSKQYFIIGILQLII